MLSKRIRNITPSATSAMLTKVAELRAAGVNVIGFNVGEPDFPTPRKVVDACEKALEEGKTKYTPFNGLGLAKEAVCRKLKKDNGLDYEPSQIVISTGAKQALTNAIFAICDEGDEVIIPTPCYVSYVEVIKLTGASAVLVGTNEDYSLNVESIAAAVTPNTKAILINTPNNPTGAVYTEAELKALGDVAEKNGLYIIADEVYEKLVYGSSRHVSIAGLSPWLYEHTVTVNGLSKACSMTGWRFGYTATNKEMAKAISSLQAHMTSCSTSFVQYAAITGLEDCAQEIEDMVKAFQERRDYLHARLTAMPGVTCTLADGAFYLMPHIDPYLGKSYQGKTIENSFDFAEFLLEQAHIAVVAGDAFVMPGTVRLAYSTSMENIKRGMDAMEKALQLLE